MIIFSSSFESRSFCLYNESEMFHCDICNWTPKRHLFEYIRGTAPKPKSSMFCALTYLKIINIFFLKSNVGLNIVVWETQNSIKIVLQAVLELLIKTWRISFSIIQNQLGIFTQILESFFSFSASWCFY